MHEARKILDYKVTAKAALLCMFLLSMVAGCNDHRFTPLAEIEVYPDVIDLGTQKADHFTEQVLLTNSSVSARLEIFEIDFEDAAGDKLVESKITIKDQTADFMTDEWLADHKTSKAGNDITYTKSRIGLVTDIPCEDDTYCYCEENCSSADNGVADKDTLHPAFKCEANPIEGSGGAKVCIGLYEFFNNAGVATRSTYGGPTEFSCPNGENDCSKLGSDYYCDEEKKCVSDIQAHFSLEYGFEQMVALKPDIINPELAAVWKGANGKELCLSGQTEPQTFYGLNRCDQIALKTQMARMIDDGDASTGYKLYPKSQANFRLMDYKVGETQAEVVTFCDGTAIDYDSIVLEDPSSIAGVNCLDSEGMIISENLSIMPDEVRVDQLPVRVLYKQDDSILNDDQPVDGNDSEVFKPNAVLTAKSYAMRISNSAKVGGNHERLVTLTINGTLGGPPTPVIELPEDQQNPEPLDVVHLDGRDSYSPFGDERKPFEYLWEWAPGGKPPHAQDAVLIKASGSFDNPVSIMGDWTSEGYPKIYFPIAGHYKFLLKVRDSKGVESGATDDCPDCIEYAEMDVHVKPSQKIHAELIWNKGDYVDMDLFLVRYRTDGTFAVRAAFQDRIQPSSTSMPNCTDASDCFEGKLQCVGGFCENACTDDAACKAIDLGWECNTATGKCVANEDLIVPCDVDDDCNIGNYCNPSKVGLDSYETICTVHNSEAVNDTCYFSNKAPRWGEYSDISLECSEDNICKGASSDSAFTCEGGTCDYSCDTSNECIEVNSNYLCSGDTAECVSNDVDDDPTLDIDDVNGWGPENISLKEPASGRYRLVARFYADPQGVVSNEGPNTPVVAYVHLYLNGEPVMDDGIAVEMSETSTYWKIADIIWDENAGTGGDGYVETLCAGWTRNACSSTDECVESFGDGYTCDSRNWGKYCSVCPSGEGDPDTCQPSTDQCNSDADCASRTDGATICANIQGQFCKCGSGAPPADIATDPYANPFISYTGALFDPNGSVKRSIWCDNESMTSLAVPDVNPSTTEYKADEIVTKEVDILSNGSCGSL